tara:strand:+ start:152 stop:526 length:375 start_codon:yes stop_codon:yes gene_type:complete
MISISLVMETNQDKQQREKMINLNDDFEYIYYFEDDGILRGVPKSDKVKLNKDQKIEVKQAIKKNGYKFYTIGDDADMPKNYGYYYSNDGTGKSTMDFEPLDFAMADAGDAWLFYQENGEYKQL